MLQIDQACLNLDSGGREALLEAQSVSCVGCPYWTVYQGQAYLNRTFVPVNTTFATRIRAGEGCQMETHFGEFGGYRLTLNSSGGCSLDVTQEPVNEAAPVFYAFLVILGASILWALCNRIYRGRAVRRFLVSLVKKRNAWWWLYGQIFYHCTFQIVRSNHNDLEDDLADTSQMIDEAAVAAVEEDEARRRKKKSRVRSLDAFRGLSIAVMIFVNYGGGAYWFFNHSRWNGLTVADLVFPWFMWIMGVSLAIGVRSQLRNSVPRKKMVAKIVKRSAILFLLGLFVNSGGANDFRTIRIPGVT